MSPDWSDKPEAGPYSDLMNPQSLNLYGYVNNNPLSRVNKDGHCCDPSDLLNFAAGFGNAFGSDNLAGAGRMDQTTAAGRLGASSGDLTAAFQGAGETVVGTGGEIAGLALDATGAGALNGVPTNVVSAGVIAQGATTATTATLNLMKAADAPGVTAGGQATDKYGNKIGPSGKPQVNQVDHSTEKGAKEAAQQGGREHPKSIQAPRWVIRTIIPLMRTEIKLPNSAHHNYPQ
jgi:hypothetical protein